MSAAPDERQDATEMFQTIPLFRGLEIGELKAVVNTSKAVSFEPGDVIVKEGDAGLGFYLITDGKAIVKRKGRKLAELGRGSFFGEMALLDDQPRSADVIAIGPTTCQVLLRWNFWSMVSKNPKIARALLQEMTRRLRATSRTLSE